MYSHILLLSVALMTMIVAVSIVIFFQSNQPQSTIVSPESNFLDESSDRASLEASVDTIMQYPLGNDTELGVLAGTIKTCHTSPRAAVHMAWQLLERKLFEAITGHRNIANNGQLSLEFLLWSEDDRGLSENYFPPGVDRTLLKTMGRIDKILIRNPIFPLSEPHSIKFVQLSAKLINQLEHASRLH